MPSAQRNTVPTLSISINTAEIFCMSEIKDISTLWKNLPNDLKGCVGWYLQFKNPPAPPPVTLLLGPSSRAMTAYLFECLCLRFDKRKCDICCRSRAELMASYEEVYSFRQKFFTIPLCSFCFTGFMVGKTNTFTRRCLFTKDWPDHERDSSDSPAEFGKQP